MAAQGGVNAMGLADVDGETCMNDFLDFLENFVEGLPHQTSRTSGEQTDAVYVSQLESMRGNEKTTLYVNYGHLSNWENDTLQNRISQDYYRYEPFLRKAVQLFVNNHHPSYIKGDGVSKEFYLGFYNMTDPVRLRDLKTEAIGKLTAVSGTVTRTSEVRPELLFGTFKCLECGNIERDIEQQFKFTQPNICRVATCSNRDKWVLLRQDSKFVDWQRVRMQENADEVPAGSLPRTLDVILRHEIVEQARAGDKVIFTGMLVVVPDVGALLQSGERKEAMRSAGQRGGSQATGEGVRGLKALGARDLTYRLCFIANSVQPATNKEQITNIRAEEEEDNPKNLFSREEVSEIDRMVKTPQLWEKLVRSVAPSVFGHLDIKRAILLMLFGGIHKKTHEGINLRGDINVCIVGDPSCAKSQFLKYVAGFLPRAVYTSGKSSSAAGLTATVVKEPETGEFCIEAGALMLADNGICCIDEFDKMDVKDQVAIHEAMEQQTISIAKAGIQASLNARTSILAAANPTNGRYDKSKPLKYNVALPPAILSRFDLVHVMIDEADEIRDGNIARHIVRVHQHKDEALEPDFTMAQLQRYIKYARCFKPELSPQAKVALTTAYTQLRSNDATQGSNAYRITVRQLEALIRLSEAYARALCATEVTPKHVAEAKRLLSMSIISVEHNDIALDEEEAEAMERDDEEDLRGMGFDDMDDGNGGDGDDQPPGAGPRPPPRGPSDGTPSRSPPESAPGPSGTENGGGAGAENGEAKAEEGSKGKMQVTHEKFELVKASLVQRLRRHEDEQSVADGGLAGMKQKELIRWFINQQHEAGIFQSMAELVAEYRLVRSIIQHMIRKEAILVVVDDGTAAVREAEAAAAEAVAKAAAEGAPPPETPTMPTAVEERLLAVNPNFDFE